MRRERRLPVGVALMKNGAIPVPNEAGLVLEVCNPQVSTVTTRSSANCAPSIAEEDGVVVPPPPVQSREGVALPSKPRMSQVLAASNYGNICCLCGRNILRPKSDTLLFVRE